MAKIVKIGIPVLVVLAIGAVGWLYLEESGQTREAKRAAGAVMKAADRAIGLDRDADRFRATEEENFVNVGAIFTVNGNVRVTLVVRGTDGADAVCNRMVFVRDYLVGVMSDYPPSSDDLVGGPVGYPGSIAERVNSMVDGDAVTRVRYDPYYLGQERGSTSC